MIPNLNAVKDKIGDKLGNLNPLKPADPVFTHEAYVTALTDMQEGRKSKDKSARALQTTIQSYIETNLNQGKKIGPGAFTTGFKHIIRAESAEALVPDDLSIKSQSDTVRELVSQALAHAKDPGKVPLCNVFSMDDAINGRPPSIGRDLPQFDLPAYGVDGHQNAVCMMQATHPAMDRLLDGLKLSHDYDNEPTKLGNDPFAWARAAWISSLMQLDQAKLLEALDGKVDAPTAARIASMAEHIKQPGGIDALTAPGASGGLALQYPPGTTTGTATFEADLAAATTALLTGMKDNNGKDIPPLAQGEVALSNHVFSLMNALQATAVIHGDGQGTNTVPTNAVSVSYPDVVDHASQLLAEDKNLHADVMHTFCTGKPIVVRMADNTYAVRLPKPNYKPNAAGQSANGAQTNAQAGGGPAGAAQPAAAAGGPAPAAASQPSPTHPTAAGTT